MHICFNALDYPASAHGGGVGNQVRILARALVRQGHRVCVIDLASGNLPDVSQDEGITIHRIRCPNWHWYLSKIPVLGRLLVLSVREIERSWAAYKCIQAIHQKHPIDLVEGTETAMLFLPLLMPFLPSIIRLHGEPYTFVKHTPDLPLTLDLRLCRILQRIALRRVRLLISPSIRHANEIWQELGKASPPLEVVPNVIAEELFAYANGTETSIKHEIDGPIVLFVGRLEHGKGVLLLLRAARRILADVPNAHFVLAGARHPALAEKEIGKLLHELPDPKRIHLLGHVPWERLLQWYSKAALCVLPSYYETFGLAALEAMAFGLPVVALSAGALPEVVEDQTTGLLVPPQDEAALAEAILRLLRNPDMGHRLGENGREAAKRFLVAEHLQDNLELFSWASRTERAKSSGDREHIFFSPHLDDVALSCGGLIHALVGNRQRVRAITVFAGIANPRTPSAFARHLQEKWGLRDSLANRLEEDRRAFRSLGLAEVEQWEYPDAPYRQTDSGVPLYCTYDELKDKPVAADGPLVEELVQRIRRTLSVSSHARRLYFPLALGGHIDHQLLFQVGLRLRGEGWDVRFYEDWPYADAYEPSETVLGWMSERVEISIAAKHAAILEHHSQLPGLGGSAAALKTRLTRYARRVGKRRPQERYWFITPTRASRMVEHAEGGPSRHLRPKPQRAGSRIIRRILSHSRGVRLAQLLPRGTGECIHFQGTDDERAVITSQGYRCRSITSNQERESIALASAAAFVAWQPLGSAAAELLIADTAALLEPGGVLVGRFACDEAEKLKDTLQRHGFRDIQIRPRLDHSWHETSALFRSRSLAFVARKAAVRA